MHVGAVSILEGGNLVDERGRFRIDDVRDLVAVAHAVDAALPPPVDARCPTTRAGPSGSTTTASTSRTTCGTPRCRGRASWEQLVALTNRVQESLLDRERPLWELWFVEGLEGGNVAIDPEDAPRADRRRVGCRRRDAAARHGIRIRACRSSPDWTPEPAPSSVAAAHRHAARAADGTGRDRAFDAARRCAGRGARSTRAPARRSR